MREEEAEEQIPIGTSLYLHLDDHRIRIDVANDG